MLAVLRKGLRSLVLAVLLAWAAADERSDMIDRMRERRNPTRSAEHDEEAAAAAAAEAGWDTDADSPPLVAPGCDATICSHAGGGAQYVVSRLGEHDEVQCSCEAYFKSGPCVGQQCEGRGQLLVEQSDGTCACESPCAGFSCGGDGWVEAVDYNRQAGMAACMCAEANAYAQYLEFSQPPGHSEL